MAKEQDKLIKSEIESLLLKMSFKADLEIEESSGVFFINLKPENERETSMLIGWHGESLEALQHLLKVIIFRKTQNYIPIVINIGEWRQRQEQSLLWLAKNVASQVKETGESITLKPMSAYQRRLIHVALADDGEIETESVGEGGERRIVVKLKQ